MVGACNQGSAEEIAEAQLYKKGQVELAMENNRVLIETIDRLESASVPSDTRIVSENAPTDNTSRDPNDDQLFKALQNRWHDLGNPSTKSGRGSINAASDPNSLDSHAHPTRIPSRRGLAALLDQVAATEEGDISPPTGGSNDLVPRR